MRYHAPENVSGVSVGGMEFQADDNGVFEIADDKVSIQIAAELADHGCVPLPEAQGEVLQRVETAPQDEKRLLIADRARYGVKADGRTRIEYLREMHAKALAEHGVAADGSSDATPGT